MLQLPQYSQTNNITFRYNKWTYEKEYTIAPRYMLNTLRRHICLIHVSFNIAEKTVVIAGIKYNIIVDYRCGYTYKKTKGNNILVSSLGGFISFISDASNKKDVFHHTASALLEKLSKNNFQRLN